MVIREDKVFLPHSYAQLEKQLGLAAYLFNKSNEATKAMLINLGMTHPRWTVPKEKEVQVEEQADPTQPAERKKKRKGGGGGR